MRGWNAAKKAVASEVGAPKASKPHPADVAERRSSGRRGRFDPNIDWELGKHLYVQGKIVPRGGGLPPEVVYPSYAEIARAINSTKQNVAAHAYRHNWPKLRSEFQVRVEKKVDDAVVESRARLISEPLSIVDSYINKFVGALEAGRVRIDAAADLDKMLRLRAFLTEREAEKSQQKQVVSLEQMAAKHKDMRARTQRMNEDESVAGVLSGEDAQTMAEGEDEVENEGKASDDNPFD